MHKNDVNKFNLLTTRMMRARCMADEFLQDRDPEINALGDHLESIAADLDYKRGRILEQGGPITEFRGNAGRCFSQPGARRGNMRGRER